MVDTLRLNKYLEPGKSGASVDDFIPWSNAGRYNYAPVNHVQNPIDQYSVYGYSDYDISDNLDSLCSNQLHKI